MFVTLHLLLRFGSPAVQPLMWAGLQDLLRLRAFPESEELQVVLMLLVRMQKRWSWNQPELMHRHSSVLTAHRLH